MLFAVDDLHAWDDVADVRADDHPLVAGLFFVFVVGVGKDQLNVGGGIIAVLFGPAGDHAGDLRDLGQDHISVPDLVAFQAVGGKVIPFVFASGNAVIPGLWSVVRHGRRHLLGNESHKSHESH